jgi:hypothetical protein
LLDHIDRPCPRRCQTGFFGVSTQDADTNFNKLNVQLSIAVCVGVESRNHRSEKGKARCGYRCYLSSAKAHFGARRPTNYPPAFTTIGNLKLRPALRRGAARYGGERIIEPTMPSLHR